MEGRVCVYVWCVCDHNVALYEESTRGITENGGTREATLEIYISREGNLGRIESSSPRESTER